MGTFQLRISKLLFDISEANAFLCISEANTVLLWGNSRKSCPLGLKDPKYKTQVQK